MYPEEVDRVLGQWAAVRTEPTEKIIVNPRIFVSNMPHSLHLNHFDPYQCLTHSVCCSFVLGSYKCRNCQRWQYLKHDDGSLYWLQFHKVGSADIQRATSKLHFFIQLNENPKQINLCDECWHFVARGERVSSAGGQASCIISWAVAIPLCLLLKMTTIRRILVDICGVLFLSRCNRGGFLQFTLSITTVTIH